MAVIFATNSHKSIAGGRSFFYDGADFIDSNYTNSCIRMVSDSSKENNVMGFGAPSGDEVWFHFRHWLASATSSSFADGDYLILEEADGTEVGGIYVSGGEMEAVAKGDTTVYGSPFSISTATAVLIDVHVNVNDGGDLTVEVYFNGVLSSTATAANTGGKTAPSRANFCYTDINANGSTSTNTFYVGEVIVDDADSTVGCRLAELEPDGDSTDTDWTGGHADISDGDDLTFILASSTGLDQSWTLSAYNGAGSPAEVRAVVNEYDAATTAAGPDTITPFLKISGTDYDNSNEVLGANYTGLARSVWAQNPATTSAWAVGDLASLVAGVRSV